MKQFFDVLNPTLVGIITLDIIIFGIVYLILIDIARIDKSKRGARILKFHNSTPPIHMVWKFLLYICAIYFFILIFHDFHSSMKTIFIDESMEEASSTLRSSLFSNITYLLLGIFFLWPPIWYLRTMYLAKKGKITIIEPERRLFSTKDPYKNIGKNIIFLLIASFILGHLF